jgi:regulator of replication initiation timing
LSIQALEKRTIELRDEAVTLRAENDQLRNRLAQVEAMLLTLVEVRK